MTLTRQRSAWIWVAIAAIAMATVARAQAGVQSATAYTHPVLEFLASHSSATVTSGDASLVGHRSDRQVRTALSGGAGSGVCAAMLPVLFVGLVAPLNLVSSRFSLSLGRTPSAPALPFSFQRPPPLFLS